MVNKLKMHAPMILIVVFNVFFGILFFGRSQQAAEQNVMDTPSSADQKLGIVTSDVDRAKLAEPEAEVPAEEPSEPTKVEITTEEIFLPTETNPDTTQPRKPELAGPDDFVPMVKKARKPRAAHVPVAAKPKPVEHAHKRKVVRRSPTRTTNVSRKVRPESFVDLMTDRFDGSNNFEGINNRFGRNN